MGTAVRPAKTSPGPWDAFADVDVFVDEVLAELEAMAKDGARPMRETVSNLGGDMGRGRNGRSGEWDEVARHGGVDRGRRHRLHA
jgi:hypothetical protein